MFNKESETVEFKQIVVDEIKKELVAFANCDGGTLYIGVTDNGEILGVAQADEVIQQITNMVRDSIKPDITMFLHYERIELDGKELVAVQIQRGTSRPYYLAKKGLRPEGVYVRQGTSSVPATDTAIRQMIKETDGDSYESMRSLEQALTFIQAKKEFEKREIVFGEQQIKSLGMAGVDGIYTNLALLLSDQCHHTIKAASFEGTNQNIFKDRREFAGSLFQQLNEVYDYIDFRNQKHSRFEKLLRIDTRDYPEEAVREALLNVIIHRDYSIGSSAIISLYDDRLELVSVGGLMTGITQDDIMMGISVCRNPKLAGVFYRLQLIEAYGTGLPKIRNAYQGTGRSPQFLISSHVFKVILPNINYPGDDLTWQPVKDERSISNVLPSGENRILEALNTKEFITRREVEELLGLGQTAAGRIIKKLVEEGDLHREGQGAKTRYYRISSAESVNQ